MRNEQLNFVKKVESFSVKNGLLSEGDYVLACLSGGADSVCLLRVLCALRERLSLTVYAAHVNHMLRGADADADEVFCRALCDTLGVELFVLRKDVRQLAHDTAQGIEAAARQVRYDYFFGLREQLKIDRIATAHNQNDNAETSLMFYLRGSGIDGIKGISARRGDGVIRPLLCVTRAQIETYLAEVNQTYVTDATNASDAYTRNRIRNCLIPQLARDYNPNIVETLARNASLLAFDAQYLSDQAAALAKRLITVDGDDLTIAVERYCAADKALGLRVLRQAAALLAEETEISYDTVMRCDALFEADMQAKTVSVTDGVYARREYSLVRFYKGTQETAGFCYSLETGGSIYVKEAGISVSATLISGDVFSEAVRQKQKNCEYFDYNSLSGQIYIRSRKNGDVFAPFGMGGEKKLKDYYIDEKIPAHVRGKIPLIVCGEEILWVCGYRRSDLHRITGETKKILKIVFWEGK